MPVCSYELGINGVCDVVEFHRAKEGAIVHGYEGHYKIIPVEYKHGSPKEDESDILQVVAQAMCLEDMFCTAVEEVHIYYGKTRRRLKLDVNSDIRNRVKEIVAEMHTLYERRYTPRVKSHKGCKACSLREICLPKLCKVKSVREYIDSAIKEEKYEKLLNTLYINSADKYLSLDGENIVISENKTECGRVPMHNIEAVVTTGYAGISPALLGKCAKRIYLFRFKPQWTLSGKYSRAVLWKCYFKKNQYRISDNEELCTQISKI